MATSIFLFLCVVGEFFLVYCLFHFSKESKVATEGYETVPPRARNRRAVTLPEVSMAKGMRAEAPRRA